MAVDIVDMLNVGLDEAHPRAWVRRVMILEFDYLASYRSLYPCHRWTGIYIGMKIWNWERRIGG